eukprot:TRINITY_DN738_c0_g1_i19.p1 TRINITY_DN738_c0_g1~~TRINITY_DN738_c0_g1_i19.p1  ORF type:complete len:634 (-),score=134.44 TRINITY_DN738_c0_g1_i19:260-2161(-)
MWGWRWPRSSAAAAAAAAAAATAAAPSDIAQQREEVVARFTRDLLDHRRAEFFAVAAAFSGEFVLAPEQAEQATKLLEQFPDLFSTRPPEMQDHKLWYAYFKLLKSYQDSLVLPKQLEKEPAVERALYSRETVAHELREKVRQNTISSRSQLWCSLTGCSTFMAEDPTFFETLLTEAFGSVHGSPSTKLLLLNTRFSEDLHQLPPDAQAALRAIVFLIGRGANATHPLRFLPDLVSVLLHEVTAAQAFAIAYLVTYQHAVRCRFFPPMHPPPTPPPFHRPRTVLLLFESLLQQHAPTVYEKMLALPVFISQVVPLWFERLFVGMLPMGVIFRIVDCFLCDGEDVLFRAAVALTLLLRPALEGAPSPAAFIAVATAATLTDPPDPEHFVQMMYAIELPEQQLELPPPPPLIVEQDADGPVAAAAPLRQQTTQADTKDEPDAAADTAAQKAEGPAAAGGQATVAGGDQPATGDAAGGDVKVAQMAEAVAEALLDAEEAPYNPSAIATKEQFDLIWQWLPPRYRVQEPHLIFSTTTDGCSLSRLYTLCEGFCPLIIVVRSAEQNVFGVYISRPLAIRRGRFRGTGEDFLFTLTPTPAKYGWSHQNRYYMLVEHTQLACGGGYGDVAAITTTSTQTT